MTIFQDAATRKVQMPRLDTIIIRFAGLTIEHLERSSSTLVKESALLVARSTNIDSQRGLLDNKLYELVRKVETSKALRRAALEVKRAIHNLRAPRLQPARFDDVFEALDDSAKAALARWSSDCTEFLLGKRLLDTGMERVVAAEQRDAIAIALADDDFNRALRSTAWKQFVQLQAIRRVDDTEVLARVERKILIYISRAAWKTSPLSTFLHIGRLVLQAPQPGLNAALLIERKYATTHANPALIDELRRLRSPRMDVNTHVYRHPRATSRRDGSIDYLKALYTPVNAGSWRSDRRSELMLGHAATQAFSAIPKNGQALNDFLSTLEKHGSSEGEAKAIARIMDREGLISLVNADSEFSKRIESLQELITEDAAASNPRWMNPDDLDRELRNTRDLIGATAATIDASGARYENGVAQLSGRICDDQLEYCLAELEKLLPNHLLVNPAYSALILAWKRVSGDASSVPLTRLLEAYGTSGQSLGRPEPVVDAATLLKAGHSAPVTAYFQIACQPDGYRLVLNQAQTFSLSQSLRSLPIELSERESLLSTYRAWLASLYEKTEPVEVPLCNRCNGLQDHPRLTNSVLDWGNEIGNPDPRIAIEDVYVSFDEQSYRFELTEKPTGRRLSFVYLGGVFPQPNWGDAYCLVVISNPFQMALPTLLDADLELAEAEGVAHIARMEQGPIVLRRALWRVPSEEILQILEGPRSEALFALRQFFLTHSMPTCVFIRPSAGRDRAKYYGKKTFRKPLFFNAADPTLYPVLSRLARLAEYVIFIEAMPGPQEQWLERVAGQRRVTELQVEFSLR